MTAVEDTPARSTGASDPVASTPAGRGLRVDPGLRVILGVALCFLVVCLLALAGRGATTTDPVGGGGASVPGSSYPAVGRGQQERQLSGYGGLRAGG